MQIVIRNISSDIYINTVVLTKNKQNPKNVYLFHCYKCGTGIQQIQGYVSSITAGYIPNENVTTITECYRCKENYTFQTHNSNHVATKLTLSFTGERVETFHCIICRTQLLQYTNMVQELPLRNIITPPSSVFCFNPTCKAVYLLKEIVSTSDIIN